MVYELCFMYNLCLFYHIRSLYFYLMERHLEIILNRVLKEYKDLLYGENSKILVERVEWVLSKKSYIINIKILTNNIEESVEAHPDGINYLVSVGWPILGRKSNTIVVSSIDIID